MRTISGDIFSSPGTPFFFASRTPPVIMSLMISTFSFSHLSKWASASSMFAAAMATDPAICPPGTEIPWLAARIRGPILVPASISSRSLVSKSPRPPTVLMVVTPPNSSSFAKPATMLYATALVRAEPMMVFTSFSLSRCFFCGFPLPARCTCILIRPGRM